MKVVDLLQSSGLQGHCTCFEAAGITTLSALAELDVSHFGALGVKDADDRRKLFFLVQRIKKALSEKTVADDVSAEPSSAGVVKVPGETANGETIETKQSKENHNIINAKRDTETAARTRGSSAPRRHHSQQRPDYCEDTDLDDLLVDTTDDDDEVVEENGDSDYSAGQDDSTSDTSATAVRKSRRIQQKARLPPTKRASTAEAPAKTTKQSEEASQHPPKTATASGNSHVTASRHYIDQTSSAVVDSSKTSTKSGIDSASTKRLSGVATPKSRSTEYRLQQPSSMRTGKQLSTIPSNMSAPMSPLVELPSTLVGGDCDAMKQNARSRSRRRSTSFDHYSVDSGSDNDSRSSNKSDVSRNSSSHHRRRCSSDPRPPLHLQRSSSSSSDKLVTAANKTQRQSLGHRSHSAIEVGSNGPRQSLGSGRLADFPAPRAMSITIQGRKEDNSFKTQIEQLRENANADYELFGIQDEQDDSEMRIRVVIRKRPMSKREIIGAGDVDVIHPLDYGSHGRIQVYQPRTRVDLTKEIDTVTFAFDNVFDEHSTNKILYERCIRNLIPSLFEEESAAVSIFAYGQTGAGKTFTMMGSNLTGLNDGSSAESIDNLGLYYMASLDIFHLLKSPGFESFTVSLSLFEIYGGKLFDLLNDRESVKCLEDSKGRVNFPGLSEHDVPDPEYLLELINLGASNRSTGTTSRNADSSRSHAIMQIHINKPVARGKKIEYSRLTVVDLAGSERGADTATASRATRLEGAEINTSLLALKEVIRAMATGDAMTHVPFRGSKLTQVLKESFVGVNCKSVMIGCISPNIGNCEQTLNTLRYADRVKERNSLTGEYTGPVDQPVSSRLKPNQLHRVSDSQASEINTTDSNSIDDFVDDAQEDPDDDSSAILDDLLASPSFKQLSKRVDTFSDPEHDDGSPTVRETLGQLVDCHKVSMTKMVSMLKDEMDIVNQAGGDYDGFDDYVAQVTGLQERQLALIVNMRELLLKYHSARTATSMDRESLQAPSEESFEDLRD